MNRQIFYKFYESLQKRIVPGLKYSQLLYEDILRDHCDSSVTWLDLGCGHHLLPKWRLEQEKELISKAKLVVGIDYDSHSLDKHKTIDRKVRGDITNLPFADNTFDLITSNMVFEHLDNPEKQLKEISRVLAKNGKLIFHTPNKNSYDMIMARMIPEVIKDKIVYILQGREEDDVFPTFYKINTPAQIEDLCDRSGLKLIQLKQTCTSAQFIMIPPLLFFELFWIKFLMTKSGKRMRSNIIATLQKV